MRVQHLRAAILPPRQTVRIRELRGQRHVRDTVPFEQIGQLERAAEAGRLDGTGQRAKGMIRLQVERRLTDQLTIGVDRVIPLEALLIDYALDSRSAPSIR